ncbi:MAG: SulP family inorganic anion transporter [Methylomonas sp.]|jgi:MFS superfamily sulfate permease-like transporter|uniref:SulP family inorganic anion transporter n=1 Tax=Methylomonas sp. TaxID=418 RepID=UPI0025E4BCB3|nr:SulP family inorganic anion transporter [Methylomonas sp.]MCK9608301.1 SulP family inorganic anion transporter [Methylomonas sp.]
MQSWLNRNFLLTNFAAGLSVAFILLPEAVAYAAIAHLSIQAAITAALAGLLCYAWLGKCPYAIVSTTSSAAALLAAVVMSLRPESVDAYAGLGAALVILTGGGLLAIAKAGLGQLSAFVSRPVLYGFSFALAITIIVKQLPKLLGVATQASDPPRILLELFARNQDWNPYSTVLGVGALLVLWVLTRFPKLPGAFLVLAAGIGLNNAVDLTAQHVALVGSLQLKPMELDLPELSMDKWLRLTELAFGLLVIIVAESWGSIRSLSLRHGKTVEPNRELFALGVANLLSGLLHGMPVGAGFSASSANEQAGATAKLAGAVAALILLLMAIFGRQWIGDIPEPLVAAAVINALRHALNPAALLKLWRIDRDQYLALAAVAGVLVFGVLHGMLLAVALSLAAAIRSFSRPVVRELAELEHGHDYVDQQYHPAALPHDNILVLRPEEPLFFASAEGILAEVRKQLLARGNVRFLVISLEESADLDATAAECLIELAVELDLHQQKLLLARVKDPIANVLQTLAGDSFADGLFWSVDDAVVAARKMRG